MQRGAKEQSNWKCIHEKLVSCVLFALSANLEDRFCTLYAYLPIHYHWHRGRLSFILSNLPPVGAKEYVVLADFPTSCSVPEAIMASIIDEQKENDCLGLSRNHPDQFYYLKKEVNGVTFHMINNHE